MRELLIGIDPIYMKIWNCKKIFIKQTLIYSIRCIKFFLQLIKYVLKYTLKYILKYILKKIPPLIRKKILTTIYCYPKIVALLKLLRIWIIKTGNINDVLQTNSLIIFFINAILFPTLKIVFNHDRFRSVILNGLRKNLFVKIELKKIIKEEAGLMAESNISPPSFYIKENSELSYSEQEIYRDFTIHSIAN